MPIIMTATRENSESLSQGSFGLMLEERQITMKQCSYDNQLLFRYILKYMKHFHVVLPVILTGYYSWVFFKLGIGGTETISDFPIVTLLGGAEPRCNQALRFQSMCPLPRTALQF